MSTPTAVLESEALLARFDGLLCDLTALDLTVCTDTELLDLTRGVERRTRQLAAVDHRLIAEIDNRGIAHDHAHRSTATFLVDLLHVGIGEARARVKAADSLAARRSLTGEPMPPVYPQLAAAQAAGSVSAAHAQLIVRTVDGLPAEVRDEQFDQLEAFLVKQAVQFDLGTFAKVARHLVEVVDPDGILRDVGYRERCRGFEMHQRPDGSAHGSFEFTPQLAEAVLAGLDATAEPRPATDGTPDPRTATQRRHDGLLDLLLLALRSGELPPSNGVTTTIVVTMTGEQAATGEGLATTGHDATVPVSEVLRWAGDARVFPVVFDSVRRVESYGTSHRIFTEGQRLAMFARDRGCSFPGCTVGLAWCEAHHVTDFAITGKTTIDDGTMLCGFHHREHERLGWTCKLLDGIPHWIAPHWIDPNREARRNHAHDPTGSG